MTPGEFLSSRLGRGLLHLALMTAIGAFLLATGTQRGVLAIAAIAWLLFLSVGQVCDYCTYRAHLNELQSIMDSLDQKYLFAECAPKPKGAYERALFSLMRRSGKSMMEAVSDARAAQREYREYIESWVHEVKSPITAAQLICQSVDQHTRRKLSHELAEIDNHVERALFYARAESPENDFLIREALLSDIAAQTIERYRTLLIQSGMRIETENLDLSVYTDRKWVCFMLGQLLQNAVRYRNQSPILTLSARRLGRQVQLAVSDNGIGIAPHELGRVFERGFTGSNGRARGGSTGMGLYLCRRLARLLEIDLAIHAALGQGATVTLTFPSKQNLSQL